MVWDRDLLKDALLWTSILAQLLHFTLATTVVALLLDINEALKIATTMLPKLVHAARTYELKKEQ